MQTAQPNPLAPISWADEDDHAPLVTDDRGQLPAFDQPALPPGLRAVRDWTRADMDRGLAMLGATRETAATPPRANRIPRVAAPVQRNLLVVELFGRLNRAARRWHLTRKLTRLATEQTMLQAELDEAAGMAMSAALLNRHSPKLQELRMGLRAELRRSYQQWLDTRQALDNLEAA